MTQCMLCDELVKWDDGFFKLTSLARVNFTPHKPYIVSKHE